MVCCRAFHTATGRVSSRRVASCQSRPRSSPFPVHSLVTRHAHIESIRVILSSYPQVPATALPPLKRVSPSHHLATTTGTYPATALPQSRPFPTLSLHLLALFRTSTRPLDLLPVPVPRSFVSFGRVSHFPIIVIIIIAADGTCHPALPVADIRGRLSPSICGRPVHVRPRFLYPYPLLPAHTEVYQSSSP